MSKPGDLKTARGTSSPTVKATNATTATTTSPGSASINQNRPLVRHHSKEKLRFGTLSASQRKPEEWSEVPIRSPNPSAIASGFDQKIGTQLFAKLGTKYRIRSANGNKPKRKRAILKKSETKPTGSKPDASKVKLKRSASSTLKFATVTIGSAVDAAVSKAGKAIDKAGESHLASKERASLPANMADLSNAEVLKIFKHVKHPQSGQ